MRVRVCVCVRCAQVVEEQLLINAKDFAGDMAQLKVKLMEYEMVSHRRHAWLDD